MRCIKWLFCALLVSCAPSNLADFQKQGESEMRALIELLQHIECREDMEECTPKIKKRVEKLTSLMIEAKKYKISHRCDGATLVSVAISNELKQEMMRIYQIKGVEEMMHHLQRHSLHKLDEFDREVSRKVYKGL